MFSMCRTRFEHPFDTNSVFSVVYDRANGFPLAKRLQYLSILYVYLLRRVRLLHAFSMPLWLLQVWHNRAKAHLSYI